jgi:predicted  nucleic acid-binding Zn-ribbon protein
MSGEHLPMTPITQYPCVCCGHLVHDQVPGSHKTCPICGWEDDLAQLRVPEMPGSSNTVSLAEAQGNYRAYGASERRNRGRTREPLDDDPRESAWRPVDVERDNIERPRRGIDYADSYPWPDTTVLYYWRSSFWRRLAS